MSKITHYVILIFVVVINGFTEEIPFSPFELQQAYDSIQRVSLDDRIISGTYEIVVYSEYNRATREHIDHTEERSYHYDLGVHVLYNNGERIAFNEYPVGAGIVYTIESGERVSAGANMPGVIVGMTEDGRWALVYRGFGYGTPWSLLMRRITDAQNYASDESPGRWFTIFANDLDGEYEPGELSWYLRRLYMIRYMYDTRFVMTVAMDKSVDFRPTEVVHGEHGARQWHSRTEKNTMLPFPVVNYEVLPSSLWVLNMPEAMPPNDEEMGEYTITPVPLDLSEYGIDGQLDEDDPFRIQEHLGYSVYLDRIAFAARILGDDDSYREYIFLVPEEGGTPEVLVEMAEGHTLEDMLFSPDGRELALQVDDEVYVINGFAALQ